MRTRPLVIGHRGNAGPAPANTLAGFQEAIALGLDMIEIDLQVTRDGEIVLVHDDTVDHTTDATGRVDSMTLAEIRQLDAGSWKSPEYRGERVPTLAETLEFTKDQIHLSLDLKDVRAIQRMAELVRDANMMDQVVVCGCDVPRAKLVREVEPRFAVVLNMDDTMCELAKADPLQFIRAYPAHAAENQMAALNMQHGYITPELVRTAHLRGLPVWAWTVDELSDIRRLIQAGVDAIYSNWPKRVLKELNGYVSSA